VDPALEIEARAADGPCGDADGSGLREVLPICPRHEFGQKSDTMPGFAVV
jgi:hypothetical protein